MGNKRVCRPDVPEATRAMVLHEEGVIDVLNADWVETTLEDERRMAARRFPLAQSALNPVDADMLIIRERLRELMIYKTVSR
jgi:hypothetical protein